MYKSNSCEERAKVIRAHQLGAMNLCMDFSDDQSCSCLNLSLWTKVVERLTESDSSPVRSLLFHLIMLFVMINCAQICGAVVDSFLAIITVGDIFRNSREKQ